MLTLLVALASLTAQAPVPSLRISAPTEVSVIDTGKLKGEPTRLAWSPDGAELYLETSERDHTMRLKNPRGFVMTAASGTPSPVPLAPQWAADYWAWKSAEYAPGHDELAIAIDKAEKQSAGTASPMGGSLGRDNMTAGGSGTTVNDVGTRA